MSARRLRPKSANARHHAEWLGLMDVSGPFLSLPVLDRIFPQGLDPHDPVVSSDLRRRYEDWTEESEDLKAHRTWVLAVLQRTLELPKEVLLEPRALTESLEVRVAQHHETLRPDLVIVNPSGRLDAGRPRVLIQIVSREQDLEKPLGEAEWKASPATRMTELLRGAGTEGVRLGLITNGEQWMLVHAPRGETAGYATWQAELWLEEPVTLRALRSLLGVRRLFGVPDKEALEALYEASANDQQEVTDRLGLQVRHAVEILVQAIDSIDQERRRKLLEGFDEKQLYSAAVTMMMRLVFLLYAEEQNLLPIEDPFYSQNYAASTLLSQLQDDEDKLGEQVLERRHAAWNRLLAVFRAVHGGIEHESLRLPAYGGGLFDPDRYPFLEGRPLGSKWHEVSAQSLPISDSTVLDLLRSIQFLEVQGLSGGGAEAQRLSFKALGVEQVGHVYESLLDHTAVRAEGAVLALAGPKEPEIALDALDELRKKDQDALLDMLVERTGKSRNAIEAALEYEIEPDDTRWIVSCGNDAKLAQGVRRWAGLVREDSHGMPIVIAEGSIYATKGSDRRSTGTHYTPRSLTEPIVQYTLEPLVYDGPADGKPQEEWVLRPARDILNLKVCDMACGSGAFLVQTCRYLSERLVDAWGAVEAKNPGHVVVTPEGELSQARPSDCIIPKDLAERLVAARRLVADRCLYGVDVNPMAVEMAKLSLWLVTLEKNRPFSFVDHAIKCGDSLLGVTTLKQVMNFSLRAGERQMTFASPDLFRSVDEASAARRTLEDLPSYDHTRIDTKKRLHADAEAASAKVRALADALIALELRGIDGDAYESQRAHEAAQVELLLHRDAVGSAPSQPTSSNLSAYAREQLRGRRPLHWPVAFPEVFSRGGFDALVGNPPFLNGKRISSVEGVPYYRYLSVHIANGVKGSADLSTFFLLRATSLVGPEKFIGLIVAKAVTEGVALNVGLHQIVSRSSVIKADRHLQWPGTAGTYFCIVHLCAGEWRGGCLLDGANVPGISGDLEPGDSLVTPARLASNADLCCVGSYVLGGGFILTEEEATRLLQSEPRNREVIFRYIGGDDVNSTPGVKATRWIINFSDWSEERARSFTDCWEILVERVWPYRMTKAAEYQRRWWQYARPGSHFKSLATRLKHVFVGSTHTKYPVVERVSTAHVFDIGTMVHLTNSMSFFAVRSSSLHEHWAYRFGSTLGETLRYMPQKCFETFPCPSERDSLSVVGARYQELRREIMLARREGLTATYNRFHDRGEKSDDIGRLRMLHVEMDQAVAAAYGWGDMDLGHGFHATKQGERYTLSEPTRREVLDRVLALNRARYADEVAKGLHSKGGKGRKAKPGKRGKTLFEAEG